MVSDINYKKYLKLKEQTKEKVKMENKVKIWDWDKLNELKRQQQDKNERSAYVNMVLEEVILRK